MSSHPPRIAIVGGGPSGLTIGLLLHKRGVPFTIFELRSKPSGEELSLPAGVLDLHKESGLSVIRELDLLAEFGLLTGDCTESTIIANKEGHVIYMDEGGVATRPEISRNALAKLFLSNLPSEAIKWEYKLLSATSVTVYDKTETELDFGVNGKHTFDLVVGADGAWSRVRNLLTGVKPEYAGMQIITLTIRQVTKKYPQLSEYIGLGSFASLGIKHGVTTQRASQDSARLYIWLTTEDEHFGATSGLVSQAAATVKGKLLSDSALLGQWGSKIKELVSVACDEESKDKSGLKIYLKPLYTLPIGHTWEHKPGVTLVGDASHLMRPSGEGVNIGMLDSLLLYRAIVKAWETAIAGDGSFQHALEQPVREFEVDMWKRAKDKAEEAEELGKIMFGTEDGAQVMAHWFKSMMEQAAGAGQ
jgi:2-polyprenyl-6-methoxyphenol hydroxylase-like FAD-dependent oxidoreductase